MGSLQVDCRNRGLNPVSSVWQVKTPATVSLSPCVPPPGGATVSLSPCVPPPGGAPRLLSVQKRSLGLVGLKGQAFKTLWTADSEPLAVTFDLVRGWYYWVEGQGSIFKTDGRKNHTVYTGGLVRFVHYNDL